MTSTDTKGISDEQINRPPLYRMHRERSYDQRAKAIIAFNTCTGDLDDKLEAAWLATISTHGVPAALALQEADSLAAIKAARVQALEDAAKLCEEFGDDYMQQAREGDNSGASDHKACAATEIADAIRLLGEDAGRGE